MKKSFLLYPFLMASYPLLFLYVYNIQELTLNQLIGPILLALTITALLWMILKKILNDKVKEALVLAVIIICFFSFGHIIELLENFDFYVPYFRYPQIIFGLFILWGYLIYFIKPARNDFSGLTRFFTYFAVILISFNLINIVIYEVSRVNPVQINKNSTELNKVKGTADNLPDIYYIMLDEFAGFDTIKNNYKYKDNDFENFLKEIGFYISNNTSTNHFSTFPNLASRLNMQNISDDISIKELYRMILDNKTAKFLKGKGYKYIWLSSAYINFGNENNPYADWDYKRLGGKGTGSNGDNPFKIILIKTTMFRILYPKIIANGLSKRNTELNKISKTAEIFKIKSPKYAFIHYETCHAPFVFDSDGGEVSSFNHENWVDQKYYLGAYKFTAKTAQKLIDEILTHNKNSVIVIQSDHGPRGLFVNGKPVTDNGEWENILNAFYFPDKNYSNMHGSDQPANTFKIVFNKIFKVGKTND